MDVAAALEILGLDADPTPEAVKNAYRALRKPLLKELNQYSADEQPADLVEKLDGVEKAYKALRAAAAEARGASKRASSGRVGYAKGDVLLDRYEVQGRLSHRPEGDTYRVVDRVRRTEVALKLIDPALVRDVRHRTSLRKGMITASHLNHPNIVRVLDLHEMPNTVAVAQQLPAGSENLWDLMYGSAAKKERLSKEVVLETAEQAAHAIAYIHEFMPHATLRPESIWLAEDGSVKVSDFGFAELERPLRDQRLSREKLGTAYWAPEQYRDDAAVDERCDQYALALILYEILSGKPSVGRIEKIRRLRRDYPVRFTAALERALSSKPQRRFADVDAFGTAALVDYASERSVPAAVDRKSILMPALILLALFAGFVFSPFGRQLADHLGSSVAAWRTAEAGEAEADLDLRRLGAMSARLVEREDALDETSRAELARVRGELGASATDAETRARIQDDLTQIVRQLVATSRRRAEGGLERMTAALDALDDLGTSRAAAAQREIEVAALAVGTAAPEERSGATVALVRRHAAAAREARRREEAWLAAVAAPESAEAYRNLLEAEAAMAIGDEAATERAYDAAADALETVAAAAEQAAATLAAFDPLAKPPGIPGRLDPDDARACVGVLIEAPDEMTDDPETAQLLATLLADANAAAMARWLVHDEGYWTFEADVGARTFAAAGTWEGEGDARTMRVIVVGDRVLDTPYEATAARGERMPGLGDLREALAAAPLGARALWCARRAGLTPLGAAAFATQEETLRAGDLTVRGSVPPGDTGCVLVDGRRFAPEDGAFEARIRVSGDVLGTWIRAHTADGLRSGPGAWMHVRTDALAPRIHVLEPAADATLEGGASVTVRAFVYDSNLKTLEVGGETRTLRRDEVYVLLEEELRAPQEGRLTLPIRAADAAGNETTQDLDWPIR